MSTTFHQTLIFMQNMCKIVLSNCLFVHLLVSLTTVAVAAKYSPNIDAEYAQNVRVPAKNFLALNHSMQHGKEKKLYREVLGNLKLWPAFA